MKFLKREKKFSAIGISRKPKLCSNSIEDSTEAVVRSKNDNC